MKYKNKDGIELSFTGNDSLSVLVKEVISKAITMLEDIPGLYVNEPLGPFEFHILSGIDDTVDFLKENFDIKKD